MKRILMCVALALSSQTLFAGQFKDGPHVGKIVHSDSAEQSELFGWQVVYESDDIFGIEFSISGQEDQLAAPAVLPDPFEADMDIQILALVLTGRVGFDIGPLHVYGSAGGGYFFTNADSENVRVAIDANRDAAPGLADVNAGIEVNDAFGFAAGIGVEFLLSETWEIFVEFRYIDLELDTTFDLTHFEANSDPSRGSVVESETRIKDSLEYNHEIVRVGVNFRF